jgi:signal transduction histidine kinase
LRLFQKQSRTVLFSGFGGLLALMVFAGVDGLRVLRSMQDRSAAIQRDFLERGRVLNQIRSDVYLSGTYARDYILDPEPSAAEKNRIELRRLRKSMSVTLASYSGMMQPSENGPVEGLRRSLDEYWAVLDPVLQWGPEQRAKMGFRFLRDEVFSRRTAMLALANDIESVNRRQVELGNARVAGLFAEFRTRLTFTLALTLAIGALLAVFASRRILDLEGQTANQYMEVMDARSQLKNLSARLVKTQEEERRALSRELHDEVGQSLSAALVGLSNLAAAARAGKNGQVQQEVGSLRRIFEDSVKTVRNITLLLRPSMLDDLGLVPALEWQAREVSRHSHLQVNISADQVSDQLPEELKTCIYRLVQEALHNVVRHANARTVRIVAQQEAQRILLSIQDDGQGFNPATSRGLGLLGMEERVKDLGGAMRIGSEPGGGTLISVQLPCTPLPCTPGIPA